LLNLFSRERVRSRATHQAVAIVGGSAAGFFTAYLLAREGLPVSVFEQSKELRPAPRTLIVTRRMNDLLGSAGEASVINEVSKFELFTDGRAASITLSEPDLIIERAKLIHSLAENARSAGAQICLGKKFQRLHSEAGRISLELQQSGTQSREQYITETVVAADGAASAVAKAAGWKPSATVPLIQAIVPLPRDMSPDTVRVWFIPEDTPYFYWLIPESPERGALGLIGETGLEARKHLETFLERRKLSAIEFQGARIPVYSRWVHVEKEFNGARVFLVGDAAAQVKVSTVGGIVTGLRGAAGVAQAILHRSSRKELRSLRRELDLHYLVRRALHHFQQSDYSRLVDSLHAPARQSLSECSRDDALKLLWRVCLSQPRLVLLGLRGLLTSRHRSFPQVP